MIFLDTGHLLAVFNPDDPLRDRALGWSTRLREPLVSTEQVLWECINALSKRRNRATAAAVASFLQAPHRCELIPASAQLLEAGLRLHRSRPDKDWSLTDCISFHVMRERGITRALAHDEHFEQAGFTALLRQEPR